MLTETLTTNVPGPNKRVFAFLIDGVTFSFVFAGLAMLFPRFGGALQEFGLWSIYFLLRDAAGGSFGKRLTGLTIVNAAGQPANMGSLIFRNLTIAIPFVAFAEYFVMKGSSTGQRWGDRWTGTRVHDLQPAVSDGRYLWYSIAVVVVFVAMRSYADGGGAADAPIEAAQPPAAPESIAALVKGLQAPDAQARVDAANALFYLGIKKDPAAAGAVPALIVAIKDPELRVRNEVASALKSMGPRANDAVPALLAALQNTDDQAWYFFADALSRIDVASARQTIPLIISAYDREDNNIRFLLIALLGDLDAPAAVVPTLIRALDDKYYRVRERAALVLGEIGPPAAAAVPELTRLLKDQDEDTREAAATSLKLIQAK